MNIRKLLLLTVALLLVGGSAVFADTVAQKVRIVFNKQTIEDGGILVDGKAYLGVREVGDLVQGMVAWDEKDKKVTVSKPNVHMFAMNGSTPFGSVEKNQKVNFIVFAQIDNLQADISAFKVTIADPYGDETYIDGKTNKDKDFPTKDNFWFTTSDKFGYEFKSSGKYTIRFWMQPAGSSSMQVVSEKTIISK